MNSQKNFFQNLTPSNFLFYQRYNHIKHIEKARLNMPIVPQLKLLAAPLFFSGFAKHSKSKPDLSLPNAVAIQFDSV
jgi:hypothetical protein